MTYFKHITWILWAAIIATLLVRAVPANAQEVDLSISPPSVELLIKPGIRIRLPFTITNRSDVTNLRLVAEAFTAFNDERSVRYSSLEKLPIKALFFDQQLRPIDNFLLSKGVSKKIFMELSVSPTAQEKDYYLALHVETQPEYLDKQYSARVKVQLTTPVLITVTKTGKTDTKGFIDSFRVVDSSLPFSINGVGVFDSSEGVPVTLIVANQGKNVTNVGGSITVRGSFGEKAVYQLNNRNVLANSKRIISSDHATGNHSVVLKGFFIGKYRVIASVLLDDGTVQLSSVTSFFAFPFKIVLFGILLAVLGVKVLRRKT